MNTPLCKCLNCDTLYIDYNPQVDARIYDVNEEYIDELVFLDDDGIAWCCPECKTDGYLVDISEDVDIHYHHTFESIEVWTYQVS